ncbi:MFS transporter [Nocardioides dubius]|uniref:Major facilitator superfamily (MFS) profile domain-containing protein n=1 Tax=Nocardioides dubius TaxID=317019 RepID=A0ABN1TWL3_9ACTN
MTTSARSRTGRLYVGLVVMATITGMVGSLGAPLVPAVAEHEDVSLRLAQWSLTATLLVGAVATPLIGGLGTGRRRRPVLLAVLGLVGIGCLLAALPLGFWGVLVGRALMGIGFGINPLAIAVARDAIPVERQRSALAMISLSTVLSAGLGFPVSALLADLVGVKGAFMVVATMICATFLMAAVTVPEASSVETRDVDWTGALLIGGGTLGVLLAITQVSQHGVGSPHVWVPASIGGLVLVAAVLWLLRRRIPLVDLRLAVSPGVLGANIAAFLGGVGMYLIMVTTLVLVQADPQASGGLGQSVTVGGLMMVPYALTSVVGARFALWVAERMSPDLLLPLGCVGFALANLSLWAAHDELWQVVVAMGIGGIGAGMTFNAIPWLMARFVPLEQTASAIGFNVVLRFIGFSIGSALSAMLLLQFSGGADHPVERGFQISSLVGVGVSLVGAVLCLALAGPARRRAAAVTAAVAPSPLPESG